MEHGTEDACQEEAGEYTIDEDVSSTVTLTESAEVALKGSRNGSIGGEISSNIHVGQDMRCLRGGVRFVSRPSVDTQVLAK